MSPLLEAIRSHGDNPSAFLALNQGNEHFAAPQVSGAVAYRSAGRYLIQFGGPFAAPQHRAELLTAFLAFAAGRRRRVMAVQLQQEDARLYAAHGFSVNQIGASYAVDLDRFTLRGGKFMRLRNKISRAMRSGLDVQEAVDADSAELDDIDGRWLSAKDPHIKELRFLIGERSGPVHHLRRIFVGRIAGEVVGYISYSPAYGSRPGWMHDLTRRHPDAPPGVMEAINIVAVERMRAEGCGWLHFGFTPFSGLDPALEMSTARPGISRVMRLLAERGERLYPARTQAEYKQKWGPHVVLPEYVAFHGRPRLGAVWQLLRATNAV